MACIQVCACTNPINNTGTDCQPLMEVITKLIFVRMIDDSGTRNFIDLTATLNDAYFTAALNNTDYSQRWFPTPAIKNVENNREAPIYENFNDGTKLFIREGVRSFTGKIIGSDGSPITKAMMDSFRCSNMGVYAIDRLGNLIGIISSDGTQMFPIELDQQSINGQFNFSTDTTGQATTISFDFSQNVNDSCLRMIAASEITAATSLKDLRGLLDIYVDYTSPTATSVVVTISKKWGTAKNPTKVTGLVVGDFASSVTGTTSRLRNVTDGADVTITGVTESTTNKGTYTLTYASQTVTDVIQVYVKKNGFDGTGMIGETAVIA